MEVLVEGISQELKNSFKKEFTCDYETLVYDIKAYALNNLTPMYFASDVSDGQKKAFLLDKQKRIEVTAKLAEAYRIICTGK